METAKTYRNLNNEIGVALTLLGLDEHHEACVVELAMRARGKSANSPRLSGPDIGVITKLSEKAHRTLGFRENIARAQV